MAYSNEFIGL